MSKIYGICMTACQIIDEIANVKEIKITNLVQIVFIDEENRKCSLKLRANCGVPLRFDTTIYSCDSKNIRIISKELIPYLVATDYIGQLEVLRFKKKILKLKSGSKGKLQVIYNNKRHFIECEVVEIVPGVCGEGSFVSVSLTDYKSYYDSSLYKFLINKYRHENWMDNNKLLSIRVQLLFTEIDVVDSLNEREELAAFCDQTGQRLPEDFRKHHISPDYHEIENTNNMSKFISGQTRAQIEGYGSNIRLNENPEPMDEDINNHLSNENSNNEKIGKQFGQVKEKKHALSDMKIKCGCGHMNNHSGEACKDCQRSLNRISR